MSKKVLIVDDSLYMRTFINGALIKIGYEVIGQAINGDAAIEMALEHKPDLITLDNVLPDMLGVDILKILKQEEKIESKVIMISAVGQEEIIQEGLALGASEYLVKPFTPEDLLASIKRVVGD